MKLLRGGVAVSALALAVTLIAPNAALAADYVDANGAAGTDAGAQSATTVTEATTTWNSGWYVVENDVTISSRIEVSGDVNLILGDDATLNATSGISVTGTNSLTIFAESPSGSGELIAGNAGSDYAAIGAEPAWSSGEITINGGSITATGGPQAAGIGGRSSADIRSITINGGTVSATGGEYGAGIGGGNGGDYLDESVSITITGGTVVATAGRGGAGIGGGGGYCGVPTINISGGVITATGGFGSNNAGGAGIGGGSAHTIENPINITGGFISATPGDGAEAIGSGGNGDSTSLVELTGGTFAGASASVADPEDASNRGAILGVSAPDGYAVIDNPDDATSATYPYVVVPSATSASGTLSVIDPDANPVYDGDPIEADMFEVIGGDVESWQYRAQGTDEWTDGLPTDAGTYEVQALVSHASGYDEAEGVFYFKSDPVATNSVTVTIEQAVPTIVVNGVDIVADEDNTVSCGEGYATYDPEKNVLTLSNAVIDQGAEQVSDGTCGIWADPDANLNIVLEGDNTVKGSIETKFQNQEADTTGNITISGSGSLTVEDDDSGSTAIYAAGSIVIDGATVNITAPSAKSLLTRVGSITVKGGAKVAVTAGMSEAVKANTDLLVTGEDTLLDVTVSASGGPTALTVRDCLLVDDGATVKTGDITANDGLTVKGGSSLTANPTSGSTRVIYTFGDVIVEEGSSLEATSQIRADSATVTGASNLTITTAPTAYALCCTYGITVEGSTVNVVGVVENGYQHNSDADLVIKDGSNFSVSSDSGLYSIFSWGDINISDSSVTSACTNNQAMRASGTVTVVNSTVLLEGGKIGLYAGEGLDLGNTAWYQWGISPTQATQSSDEGYDLNQYDTYLRIEPAGTTYDVTVDGETSSHVPGSEVKISAKPYDADGHFVRWEASDDETAALIADPSSPETTLTVPAGGATVTAAYEPHVLTHHDAQAPTCEDAGWEAYDECACGYSTYEETPATGHDYVDGVCTVCGAKDPDYVAPEDPDEPVTDPDEEKPITNPDEEPKEPATKPEPGGDSAVLPTTGDPTVLLAPIAASGSFLALSGALIGRRRRF